MKWIKIHKAKGKVTRGEKVRVCVQQQEIERKGERGKRQDVGVRKAREQAWAPTPDCHSWLPCQYSPPETDCDACSSHSCTRSNTQVQCKATLKAHQAHTLLVGNTLFMTEQPGPR